MSKTAAQLTAADRLYSATVSYFIAQHLGNPAHIGLADRALRDAVQGYEQARPMPPDHGTFVLSNRPAGPVAVDVVSIGGAEHESGT